MSRLVLVFFISLGVVLGGSILGSLGATLTRQSPIKVMVDVSKEIKLWAVVTAIGGTFSSLKIIEGGVFEGRILVVIKQLLLLIISFLGAQLGVWLLSILSGGN